MFVIGMSNTYVCLIILSHGLGIVSEKRGPVNAADFGTKDWWPPTWHPGLQIWHLQMTVFHAPWPQPVGGPTCFLAISLHPIAQISCVADSTPKHCCQILTFKSAFIVELYATGSSTCKNGWFKSRHWHWNLTSDLGRARPQSTLSNRSET